MRVLKGKKALIIGGTGDIGLETAKLLVSSGIETIITGRGFDRAQSRASSLGALGKGMQVDPGDESDLHRLFSDVGEVDFFLVTLGMQAVTRPFKEMTEAEYQIGLDGKFFFYMRSLRASLGLVKESVTWLTGAAGRSALPGLSNYGATCGALHGLLGSLAMELAPLRINCVASGVAKTEFWNGLGMPAEAQQGMFDEAAKAFAAGYVAGPEDIAEALFFAATNRYSTGTIMDTSGGMQLGRLMPGEGKAAVGGQA